MIQKLLYLYTCRVMLHRSGWGGRCYGACALSGDSESKRWNDGVAHVQRGVGVGLVWC